MRGAQCLAEADAVVLDALVNRRTLEHCRPGVRVINAGKRGHGRVLMRQRAINKLLAGLARQGKNVVRLKGGDPTFFGRGGEEAEALSALGLPFEIVPGVSSVTAVPAYAGIPLTHRGHASVVTVVTGHEGRENPYLGENVREARRRVGPGVDWARLSPDGTLVILMGLLQLPEIVRKLRAAGWPLNKPAAVTQSGTWPQQKTVEGNLGNIVSRVRREKLGAPAVILVGSVASLRRRLSWWERLPLFGKTILVTRAQTQSSSLVRALEAQGANVLEGPTIRIQELPPSPRGRRLLRKLARYDGVLFTSANAARAFVGHWERLKKTWPRSTAVYAVGIKTGQALVTGGLPVHAMAKDFESEALAALLIDVKEKIFLFPRAEEGRDLLVESLTRRGAGVDLWPLYRTTPVALGADVRAALLAGRVHAATFTSSSTVHAFMREFTAAQRRKIFRATRAASIGPITSKTLKSYGIVRVLRSLRATTEDLAEVLRKRIGR